MKHPALLLALCAGCAASEQPAPAFDWDRQLGVVAVTEGAPCLRIANRDLQPGTSLLLVSTDTPQRTRQTQVGAQATSCPGESPAPDLAFYRLPIAAEDAAGELWVAVIDRVAGNPAADGAVQVDVDLDGTPEQFRGCTSGEGVHLTAWSGAPLASPRRWEYYHYLGYDVEPSCVEADYAETQPETAIPELAAETCTAHPGAPSLDHVVLVVRDLDTAAAGFARAGFRLKPGRLHPNNLLNRHVKFRDGSGIELMSVTDPPGDAMAQDYARLLEAGEGGVYVALRSSDLARVEQAAGALDLATVASASGEWRFVGFPAASPAAAIFFSAGDGAVQDAESVVTHAPDVTGLAEAWLEGGTELSALLEQLGAVQCGQARTASGDVGVRLALARGSVVITPAQPGARPRLLGVVLHLREPGGLLVVNPHPAFWVRYEYMP